LDWPNEVIVCPKESTCDIVHLTPTYCYWVTMQEFPVILVQWETPAPINSAAEDLSTRESPPSPDSVSTNSTVERKITPPQAEPLPSLKIVDQFHSYVRPTWRPDLSTFCTSLTGITQVSRDRVSLGLRRITNEIFSHAVNDR
jgi:hypothetical protein